MANRSTNCTLYSAKYDIVRCLKWRRVLVNGVDAWSKEIIGEHDVTVVEVQVMPDHVHLSIEIPPTVSLCRLVCGEPCGSFLVPRGEFAVLRPVPSLRTRSWFVSTLRGALEVRRHVENQKRVA